MTITLFESVLWKATAIIILILSTTPSVLPLPISSSTIDSLGDSVLPSSLAESSVTSTSHRASTVTTVPSSSAFATATTSSATGSSVSPLSSYHSPTINVVRSHSSTSTPSQVLENISSNSQKGKTTVNLGTALLTSESTSESVIATDTGESTGTSSYASDYTADSVVCVYDDILMSSPCGGHVQRRGIYDQDLMLRQRLDGIQHYINDTIENYIFQQYLTSNAMKQSLLQTSIAIFPRNFNNQTYQDKLTVTMTTLYSFVAYTNYIKSCGLTHLAENNLSHMLDLLIAKLYQSLCDADIVVRRNGLRFVTPSVGSLLSSNTVQGWAKSRPDEIQQLQELYFVIKDMEKVTGEMKEWLIHRS